MRKRTEVPPLTHMGKPGSAYLPRANRTNRKRSFPALTYFDAHHEQRTRERTTLLQGWDSATTSDSQGEESDVVSESELGPSAAISRPLPATAEDSDEDRADFNFGTPSSTAATQGSQSSGN